MADNVQEREARTRRMRQEVDARPEGPADFICEAIGDAVREALAAGYFAEYLQARGWALVYIGDGETPEPPGPWLHDGLDMTEPGWIDPIGRLAELWRTAWEAGHRAGKATQ